MPKQGHMKRALRLFGYLKHHAKARLEFDPSDPNLEGLEFQDNDWTRLYPDAEEDLPDNAPTPKTRKVIITVYVDASHATCLETRRSVTGYIICIGKAPVMWYSKRQSTVESSTYGSELVAKRIAAEALLGLRYKLRMMGIGFEQTSNVLCDNQSVVIQTQYPSSSLKKKHNAVAFMKLREMVAAKIIRTAFIPSSSNVADIETKPKGPADFHRLLCGVLYGREVKETRDSRTRDSGDATQEGELRMKS